MFDTLRAAQSARSTYRSARLPAPVRGLIRNENIALSKPAGAEVLQNWFPTATGIVTRRGKRKHATLNAGPVASIMPYTVGTTGKLFAANATGIYDATNPATPSTVLTAQSGIGTVTNGNFSSVQFSTSGGNFLVCVNGENLHKIFNGASWSQNSPAITGTTSDNFSHIWAFKERLFFTVKDTLKFAYLPVDSIGGAAVTFDLGPVFSRGGFLLTGGTWSTDAGGSPDDLCVFITSEGEVAVYAGDDPSDSVRWVLQGIYRTGKPLGKKAMFRAGGDLALATRDGLIPLSAAYSKAQEALSDVAVSHGIEELWAEYAESRSTIGWQLQNFTGRNSMLWVAPPVLDGQSKTALIANMRTGAWTTYTGYDIRSMGTVGNSLYVGETSGLIYEAETGGSDDGNTYTARAAGLWDNLKAATEQKTVTMVRGTFRSNILEFDPQWSIGTDYENRFPSDPAATPIQGGSVWGSSTWGSSTWGGSTAEYRTSEWEGVEGVGHMISWQNQITLGNPTAPDIELASIEMIYEVGETLA